MTFAGTFNLVTINGYVGAEGAVGKTFQQLISSYKTAASANGITQHVMMYVMGDEHQDTGGCNGSGSGATYQWWQGAVNAANWWVRNTPYPTGSIVGSSDGEANTGTLQLTTSQTNTMPASTINGKTNVNQGMTFAQTFAQYYYDLYVNNLATTKYGETCNGGALAADSLLDGMHLDNQFPWNRVAGAWFQQTSGSNTAAQNLTVAADMQNGRKAVINALHALNPNFIVKGNVDFYHQGSGLTVQSGWAYDVVYSECYIGGCGFTNPEGQGGTTELITSLIAQRQVVATNGALVLDQQGQPAQGALWTSQSAMTPAMYQGLRYGFAIAELMDAFYYAQRRQLRPVEHAAVRRAGPGCQRHAQLRVALNGHAYARSSHHQHRPGALHAHACRHWQRR